MAKLQMLTILAMANVLLNELIISVGGSDDFFERVPIHLTLIVCFFHVGIIYN